MKSGQLDPAGRASAPRVMMVSSQPGRMCGVADYTARLAQEIGRSMPCDARRLDIRLGYATYLRDVWSLTRAMVRARPASVHLQYTPTTLGPLAPAIAWFARAAGLRVAISAHERPSTYDRHLPALARLIFRVWERALYRAARTVFVFSSGHRMELKRRYGVDSEVMPLGIDPVSTPGYRRPNARPVVTFAGFVRPSKGVEDLVDAAPLIAEALGGCDVRVVGAFAERDAGYADRIRRRAQAESAGRNLSITVTGGVAAAEFERHLAETDVFVFPFRTVSQSITFGGVVARGTPVVASAIGGVGDAVRAYGAGLTYEPGDVQGLARAVAALLTDASRYAACAGGARSYAAAASWDRIAGEHVEMYRELAG